MEKGEKYMVNKKKFYSIALVSTAMILLLVSIVGAAPFAYITNTDSYNVSVIDTATNTVTSSVPLGLGPWELQSAWMEKRHTLQTLTTTMFL